MWIHRNDQQDQPPRTRLQSKRSLSNLMGLGQPFLASRPPLPLEASIRIAQQIAETSLQDGPWPKLQSHKVQTNKPQEPKDDTAYPPYSSAFETPKKPAPSVIRQDLRQFSFTSSDSHYSDYFVQTPKPSKLQPRVPERALRAVKSMEAFKTSSSMVSTEKHAESQYMSMQELLSAKGFADTRIITPETIRNRQADLLRPTAQAIFANPVEELEKSTDIETHHSSPAIQRLRAKASLVGLLGSIWSGTQPAQFNPFDTPTKGVQPPSPRSISSQTSSEGEDEADDLDVSYEADQVSQADSEAQHSRISSWVTSTTPEQRVDSVAERPWSPSASIGSHSNSSLRSARSLASLITHQPALPSLCLESDPRWQPTLDSIPPSPAATITSFASVNSSDGTIRPSDELCRKLRHAASVPALKSPVPRPILKQHLTADTPSTSRPKMLRKATSVAILRSAPLVPVLTESPMNFIQQTPNRKHKKTQSIVVAADTVHSQEAKTQVVKLPSPERKPGSEPQGKRSDVRGLFDAGTTPMESIENQSATAQFASPTPATKKRGILGIVQGESVRQANGNRNGARQHLKDLLGKSSEKVLPFSVGMVAPQGVQRLGKGVKAWEIEDNENVAPKIIVDTA